MDFPKFATKLFRMKKIILLWMLAVAGVVMGQEPKPRFHEFKREFKGDPKIIIHKVLDNKQTIILKKEAIKGPGGWNYFIEKRDENFNLIETKNVTASMNGDEYAITEVHNLGNHLLCFSFKNDKRNKRDEYYTQTINVNDLKVSSRKLFHSQTYEKKRERFVFDVDLSKNGENFLITIIPPYDKEDEEKISLKLLDKELNEVWSYEDYGLGVADKGYYISDVVVGSHNEVYFIGNSKETGREIRVFTADDVQVQKVEELEDGDIRMGSIITIDLEGNLIFTGYITDEDTRGAKGGYYMVYSPLELDLIDQKTWEFSKELLFYGVSQKKEEKQVKKADKKDYKIGANNLTIDDVLYDEFNNIYIVGSEYWVEVHTTVDGNGNVRTYYTYNSASVYVTKINVEGEIVYNVKIPRHEEHRFPRQSLLTSLNGEELSFLYLDHPNNLDENTLAVDGVYQNSSKLAKCDIVHAKIDANGGVKREKLFNVLDSELKSPRLDGVLNYSERPLMLFYIGKKQWRLLSFYAE